MPGDFSFLCFLYCLYSPFKRIRNLTSIANFTLSLKRRYCHTTNFRHILKDSSISTDFGFQNSLSKRLEHVIFST